MEENEALSPPAPVHYHVRQDEIFTREGHLIELDSTTWERVYREALGVALRITHTRDPAQQATSEAGA